MAGRSDTSGRRGATSWFVPVVAVVGCTLVVDPEARPSRCVPDGPSCGAGWVCAEVSGEYRCLIATGTCQTDDDCASGPRPYCETGTCVACRKNSDCAVEEGGRYCFDNACVPGCGRDGCCCPPGDQCLQGLCRSPQPEECNNRDDDFDGLVDEDFDQDHDGVSSCAFVSPVPDCDNRTPVARPGLDERCDGRDNNCDGNIDENNPCPPGEVCDRAANGCVPSDDPCFFDADCGSDMFCELETGLCQPRRVQFGRACIDDGQCEWGRCLTTAALGLPGKRCTEICCSERDCPGRAWCADSGAGVKLCAPPEWHRATTVPCGEGHCPTCIGMDCHRQCCSDGDCDRACQLAVARTPLSGAVATTVCDVRLSGRGLYDTSDCGELDSRFLTFCSSGYQWVIQSRFDVAISCLCTAPCCRDDDCRAGGAEPMGRCVVASSGASVCYAPSVLGKISGSRQFGAPCQRWNQCDSGVCHPRGYCSRVCCPGGQCPGNGLCEPHVSGGESANLCTL